MPRRTYLSQQTIPEKCGDVKEIMKQEHSKRASIALTTNFWSNISNDEWQLQECLLQSRGISGRPTADYVADLLMDGVTEWEIVEK